MTFQIRPIVASEFEALHALRLFGLREYPDAFGATYEEDAALPPERIRNRFTITEENFVIGAFAEDGRMVGMAGFKREDRIKTRHKGFIWGMYVLPEARRHGIASHMLQEILNRARQLEGLCQVTLGVITTCEPAVRLYRANGFEENGLERGCLRQGDEYHDNLNMVYWV
jgi:ribosomal protein S18 acetylase RimI-like enzyme